MIVRKDHQISVMMPLCRELHLENKSLGKSRAADAAEAATTATTATTAAATTATTATTTTTAAASLAPQHRDNAKK